VSRLRQSVRTGPDSTLGTADDMANQTSFFAGRLRRDEMLVGLNAAKAVSLGLREPVNVAIGAAFRVKGYEITRGELASYVNGHHLGRIARPVARTRRSSPASAAGRDEFAPHERGGVRRSRNHLTPSSSRTSPAVRALLRLRLAGDRQDRGPLAASRQFTARAALSTGFRAPGLTQSHFSRVNTKSSAAW